MAWLYAGQEKREFVGAQQNEAGDKQRLERENYMGTIVAPHKYPYMVDRSIRVGDVPSMNTLGERPNPAYAASGLTQLQQAAMTRFYDASINGGDLQKDGNPYHDRYTFNLNIYPEPMGKQLNATTTQKYFVMDDTDDEDEMKGGEFFFCRK